MQIKLVQWTNLKNTPIKMRETAIDIFSGGVAGMVSTAMGHPFDTLKKRGLKSKYFMNVKSDSEMIA